MTVYGREGVRSEDGRYTAPTVGSAPTAKAKLVRSKSVPVISMFYGIIVSLYYLDNQRHHLAHIHVRYQGNEAVYAIETGHVLDGALPDRQHKLVVAWMELHRDELLANWDLAVNGQEPFKIEPLR